MTESKKMLNQLLRRFLQALIFKKEVMYAVEIIETGEIVVRDKHKNITTYPSVEHAPDAIQERICLLKLLSIGKSCNLIGARVDESSFLIFEQEK